MKVYIDCEKNAIIKQERHGTFLIGNDLINRVEIYYKNYPENAGVSLLLKTANNRIRGPFYTEFSDIQEDGVDYWYQLYEFRDLDKIIDVDGPVEFTLNLTTYTYAENENTHEQEVVDSINQSFYFVNYVSKAVSIMNGKVILANEGVTYEDIVNAVNLITQPDRTLAGRVDLLEKKTSGITKTYIGSGEESEESPESDYKIEFENVAYIMHEDGILYPYIVTRSTPQYTLVNKKYVDETFVKIEDNISNADIDNLFPQNT